MPYSSQQVFLYLTDIICQPKQPKEVEQLEASESFLWSLAGHNCDKKGLNWQKNNVAYLDKAAEV